MGTDIADYATVSGFSDLWDFFPVNEKISVSSIDVAYSLEYVTNVVGHSFAPFVFIRSFLEL